MPDDPLKLLLFAPCERAIIGGADDNTGSLIAILQGFEVGLNEEKPDGDSSEKDPAIPMMPIPWYSFSLWENNFSGITYTQRFELHDPDGKKLISGETHLAFDEKRFYRVAARVPGFPLRGFGDYHLVLLLKAGEEEYIERARFPIPVNPHGSSE